MAKTVLEEVVKELKLVKVIVTSSIGGHGDQSTKLFGSQKPFYEGQ